MSTMAVGVAVADQPLDRCMTMPATAPMIRHDRYPMLDQPLQKSRRSGQTQRATDPNLLFPICSVKTCQATSGGARTLTTLRTLFGSDAFEANCSAVKTF
jgi:hypothetical protein